MPLFDFQCADCRTIFEALLKTSSDAKDIRCEQCGSARVEKQLPVFVAGGGSAGGSSKGSRPSASGRRAGGGGGGGCGPSCGCHH